MISSKIEHLEKTIAQHAQPVAPAKFSILDKEIQTEVQGTTTTLECAATISKASQVSIVHDSRPIVHDSRPIVAARNEFSVQKEPEESQNLDWSSSNNLKEILDGIIKRHQAPNQSKHTADSIVRQSMRHEPEIMESFTSRIIGSAGIDSFSFASAAPHHKTQEEEELLLPIRKVPKPEPLPVSRPTSPPLKAVLQPTSPDMRIADDPILAPMKSRSAKDAATSPIKILSDRGTSPILEHSSKSVSILQTSCYQSPSSEISKSKINTNRSIRTADTTTTNRSIRTADNGDTTTTSRPIKTADTRTTNRSIRTGDNGDTTTTSENREPVASFTRYTDRPQRASSLPSQHIASPSTSIDRDWRTSSQFSRSGNSRGHQRQGGKSSSREHTGSSDDASYLFSRDTSMLRPLNEIIRETSFIGAATSQRRRQKVQKQGLRIDPEILQAVHLLNPR